jgi:uncharacterized membrane protein
MIPVFALVVLFVAFTLAGRTGVPFAWGWWTSLRLALCGMFLLTASAHWGKRRPDLVRMVPPVFRRPDLLVTLTGVLEIAGALGLPLPYTARPAALALCLLLFCLFPANIRRSRENNHRRKTSAISFAARGDAGGVRSRHAGRGVGRRLSCHREPSPHFCAWSNACLLRDDDSPAQEHEIGNRLNPKLSSERRVFLGVDLED